MSDRRSKFREIVYSFLWFQFILLDLNMKVFLKKGEKYAKILTEKHAASPKDQYFPRFDLSWGHPFKKEYPRGKT